MDHQDIWQNYSFSLHSNTFDWFSMLKDIKIYILKMLKVLNNFSRIAEVGWLLTLARNYGGLHLNSEHIHALIYDIGYVYTKTMI